VETGRWTVDGLVATMTGCPAGVLGIGAGSLRPGAEASLTLFKVGRRSVFGETRLRSRSRNCPWLGAEVSAACAGTLWRGREAFAGPAFFPRGLFEGRG